MSESTPSKNRKPLDSRMARAEQNLSDQDRAIREQGAQIEALARRISKISDARKDAEISELRRNLQSLEERIDDALSLTPKRLSEQLKDAMHDLADIRSDLERMQESDKHALTRRNLARLIASME